MVDLLVVLHNMEPISALQEEAKRIMRERRWDDAIQILQKDIKANLNDPWSPMFLGSCYYEIRDYETALYWFRHAHCVDPELPTPLGLQGDALHCLGRFDEAREHYLHALEVAPDDELGNKNWKRFCELQEKQNPKDRFER